MINHGEVKDEEQCQYDDEAENDNGDSIDYPTTTTRMMMMMMIIMNFMMTMLATTLTATMVIIMRIVTRDAKYTLRFEACCLNPSTSGAINLPVCISRG